MAHQLDATFVLLLAREHLICFSLGRRMRGGVGAPAGRAEDGPCAVCTSCRTRRRRQRTEGTRSTDTGSSGNCRNNTLGTTCRPPPPPPTPATTFRGKGPTLGALGQPQRSQEVHWRPITKIPTTVRQSCHFFYSLTSFIRIPNLHSSRARSDRAPAGHRAGYPARPGTGWAGSPARLRATGHR